MDFGASAVWEDVPSFSSSIQPSAVTTQVSLFAPPKDDPFDDFDDFGDAKDADPTQNPDDDEFGDFGDFAEETVATIEGGQDDDEFGFPSSSLQDAPLETSWKPLRLNPMPNPMELTEEVGDLLSSVVRGADIDAMLTGDGVKQIESPVQLLVTPDRCVFPSSHLSGSHPLKSFFIQDALRGSSAVSPSTKLDTFQDTAESPHCSWDPGKLG